MKALRTVPLLIAFGAASMFGQAATSPCPTAAFSTIETGGPPGNQPYVSAGGGCNVLITFAANGSVTTTTANPNAYDGVEDTLVGVMNLTSAAITQLNLTSTTPIFDFDGDGICFSAWGVSPCNSGANGYEGGANVSFTSINAASTSGTVKFSPGIAPGGSTFFSLEGPPSISITVSGGGGGGGTVPEPGSLLLFASGVGGLVALRRLRKTSARV